MKCERCDVVIEEEDLVFISCLQFVPFVGIRAALLV